MASLTIDLSDADLTLLRRLANVHTTTTGRETTPEQLAVGVLRGALRSADHQLAHGRDSEVLVWVLDTMKMAPRTP